MKYIELTLRAGLRAVVKFSKTDRFFFFLIYMLLVVNENKTFILDHIIIFNRHCYYLSFGTAFDKANRLHLAGCLL